MRPHLFGAALLVFAPLLLLVTGNTAIVTSSDEGAAARPLWVAVVPVVAGLVLARLVPPSLPALSTVDSPALRRQARWLVGIAVAFPLIIAVTGSDSLAYPLVKGALFLGGTILVLRLVPAEPVALGLSRWRWLGPVPAILLWGLLTFGVTTDLDPYRDLDPALLWGATILTFFTASILEEYFYRMRLQTRLEALHGRWPAIVAASLLFAAMHLPSHLHTDRPWVAVAAMLTFQGLFGVFVGYLWSRFRAAWAIITAHAAVNALPLLPLLWE